MKDKNFGVDNVPMDVAHVLIIVDERIKRTGVRLKWVSNRFTWIIDGVTYVLLNLINVNCGNVKCFEIGCMMNISQHLRSVI